jgi:Ca2+-binding EF-hand superfamily protein
MHREQHWGKISAAEIRRAAVGDLERSVADWVRSLAEEPHAALLMLALVHAGLLSFSAITGTRAKFDTLIASVTLSPKAIEFIDSKKQRLLFKGVIAAVERPMVQNAFAIVYEDLGPVRVAGDLIAKPLSKVAVAANEKAAATGDIAALVALAASRNLFRLVDSDASGSVDRAELLRSPLLLDQIRAEGEDDATAVDRFMAAADTDGDGVISFLEFVSAAGSEPRLQMVVGEGDDAEDAQAVAALANARALFDCIDSDESGSLTRTELLSSPALLALICDEGEDGAAAVDRFLSAADTDNDDEISFVELVNAAASEPRLHMADIALEAAIQIANDLPSGEGGRRSMFGRKAPGERFDAMLEQCTQWEAELGCTPDDCDLPNENEDDGRMLQVLKGSFAGARCQPIADALRVCYLEYSPLRLGGDVIFKLLKRVVASQNPSKPS